MTDAPVLLVTGASSGIGEATARRAAAAGHRVVLAARRRDRGDALAAELGGPAHALAVATDVADWSANEALVAAALEAYGRLDVVLANAGHGARAGWLQDEPERWRSMVLTNVLGTALTLRAALPAVLRTRGHLVIMGSVGGRRVRPGSFYSCTKWAGTAMAEALRQELDGSGVRVTVVQPGTVETEFVDRSHGGAPLGADDVARAVLYAVGQPRHVDVNEVVLRPVAQST